MDFDYRLALMCGTDIPFPQAQLVLHQPSLKEIALIGETVFFEGIQTIGLQKSMFQLDESVLDDISNFQIFMMIMSQKETVEKKQAVQQVFSIVLPEYTPVFLPQSLIFQKQGQAILIDEKNFDDFQKIFRQMFCLESANAQDQMMYNPANEKAREIANKIMEGRRRVAELKGVNSVSIFSQYISIIVVGLNSMSMSETLALTVYQLYDLIERFGLWQNWDIDLRAKLAGSTDKRQVENWMKNIH